MNYMRGFQFIKDRKNWVTNVLLGTVCMLIPVIGGIVFVGYLFEIIEALHKDPERKEYPDFDFNRFMEYLSRGIWPWLVHLLFIFVIAIPIMLFALIFAVFASAVGPHYPALVLVVGVLVALLLSIVATLLGVVVFGPALHAGLRQEFQLGPMLAFGKDFFNRLKKEMFVTGLVLLVCSLLSVIPIAITCGLATYPLMAVLLFAEHHWLFQMYELYLQRGGAAITPAEPVPTAEPV